MELVVDANILVAGFLRTAITRELLLDERLPLSIPEFGLREAELVLTTPRFRRRLGSLPVVEIRWLLSQLTARIRILPSSAYHHCQAEARRITPDPDDAPYLALAIQLRMPLWSNDAALRAQRVVMVYTTQELLELLS